MKPEKMDLLELRQQVIADSAHVMQGRIHPQALAAFDELAFRYVLKDAALLLERDRLADVQRLHELDERIIRVSADAAKLQNNKLKKAERELETEQMRLAGCSVAALGYFNGCADEYKSASLSDVLALRERYNKAVSAYKEVSECDEKSKAQVKMLVEALEAIRNELGIPQPGYPQPVANAADIAKEALIKIKE